MDALIWRTRPSMLSIWRPAAVVAVTVQPADKGDTETVKETLIEAAENVEKAKPQTEVVKELVTDKGYHSNALLEDLAILRVRTYISEPARGRRNWQGKHPARDAVYGNRRRIGGTRGLLRQRGERLERPFAHAYETGGLRRGLSARPLSVKSWPVDAPACRRGHAT